MTPESAVRHLSSHRLLTAAWSPRHRATPGRDTSLLHEVSQAWGGGQKYRHPVWWFEGQKSFNFSFASCSLPPQADCLPLWFGFLLCEMVIMVLAFSMGELGGLINIWVVI